MSHARATRTVHQAAAPELIALQSRVASAEPSLGVHSLARCLAASPRTDSDRSPRLVRRVASRQCRTRQLSVRIASVFAVSLISAGGCATGQDLRDPQNRPRMRTAYTLARNQVGVEVGAGETELDEFGVHAELGYGFGKTAEVTVNVAHAALAVPNLRLKYNFIDRERWALAASAGIRWTRPSILYVLDDETQEQLGDTDIVTVPLELVGSFPVARWVTPSLGIGYRHTSLFGRVTQEDEIYEGALGYRWLHADPHVSFHVIPSVSIFVGMNAPIYTWSRVDAVLVETVAPGVRAGVRTGEWDEVPWNDAVQYYGGVEAKVGPIFLRGSISHGFLSRALDWPVVPAFSIGWRS